MATPLHSRMQRHDIGARKWNLAEINKCQHAETCSMKYQNVLCSPDLEITTGYGSVVLVSRKAYECHLDRTDNSRGNVTVSTSVTRTGSLSFPSICLAGTGNVVRVVMLGRAWIIDLYGRKGPEAHLGSSTAHWNGYNNRVKTAQRTAEPQYASPSVS